MHIRLSKLSKTIKMDYSFQKWSTIGRQETNIKNGPSWWILQPVLVCWVTHSHVTDEVLITVAGFSV